MRESWPAKPLGELADISYGYTEKAVSEPIGPRFLRITDIQYDSVDWDSVPYCKIDAAAKPVDLYPAVGDLVLPEALESVRGQGSIAHSRVDRLVAEIMLDRPGVLAVIGKLVTAGVAEHVAVNKK